MTRLLPGLLLLGSALVVGQQQILLHRPPRLVDQITQPIHSGSAALDLRFSRAMQRDSVATTSGLSPELPHRWLGDNNPLRLVLDAEQPIETPLQLRVAGKDQRGQSLQPLQSWWDPRPWLVVTRMLDNGEQLQLLDRQGNWQPLSQKKHRIQSVVPLGNGRGIAMVDSDDDGGEQIWLQRLAPRSVARQKNALQQPSAGPWKRLIKGSVLFAHLSSNLSGDLLVQTGGFTPGSERIQLIRADGSKRDLEVLASGPMQLLPAGGGLVVPSYNGLSLQPLVDNGRTPQMLPGSRELGAFCAASGRALLVRHWPDYRRSIELVIPGLAPKQLHLGEQAVLAVACNGGGTRIWAVLGRWRGERGEHEIVLMDGDGKVIRRRSLSPWTLLSGASLQFDPVGKQLLMTVTRSELNNGKPALMDADTLEWREVMPIDIKDAQWLSAG